jgi:PhoH-like ATPase
LSIFEDVSEHRYGKTARHFKVPSSYINELFRLKEVALPDEYIADRHSRADDDVLWPNQAVSLVANDDNKSALALVTPDGTGLTPCRTKIGYYGIEPRNREQAMLFNLMDDPEVRVIVVTGAAGTGKSTAIGAYALDQVMGGREDSHEKLILSKPLEIVTKTRYWGTVPGDENDKFGPFLKSFSIMFENMIGRNGTQYIRAAIERKQIEFLPLELMRGATLRNAIVWYDEAQNLNQHECATLGTRIDDVGHSKLVLSGDLNQRDRNLKRIHTGLHKLTSDAHFLRSPLTAHIDLKVIERGEIAELFHNVFESDLDSRE